MNIVKNDHTTIMEVQNSLGYTYCYVVKETESTLEASFDDHSFSIEKDKNKTQVENYNALYDGLCEHVDTLPEDDEEI